MQQLFRMRDADGNDYDVPNSDMAEFSGAVPNAANVTRYRDANGNDYDVPDADKAEFSAAVPNAQPLRRVSFANGTTRDFTMPEMAKFLRSKEWRESDDYKADREERDRAVASRISGGTRDDSSFLEEYSKGLADAGGTAIGRTLGGALSRFAKFTGFLAANARPMGTESTLSNREFHPDNPDASPIQNARNNPGMLVGDAIDGVTDILFPNAPQTDSVVAQSVGKAVGLGAGLAEFALTPTVVLAGGHFAEGWEQTFDAAKARGATDEEASTLGVMRGSIDAAITTAFKNAPTQRILSALGYKPSPAVLNAIAKAGEKGIAGVSRASIATAVGKQMLANAVISAFEMGSLGGLQGYLDNIVEQEAATGEIDWDKALKVGFSTAGEQAAFGATMGLLPTAFKVREAIKQRDAILKDTLADPLGVVAYAHANPAAADTLAQAWRKDGKVSRRVARDAGLPEMDEGTRNGIGETIALINDTTAKSRRARPDEIQSKALDDTIKGITGGEENASKIREKVLSRIDDAKTLDDPQARERLVEEAANEVYGESNDGVTRTKVGGREAERAAAEKRAADNAAAEHRAKSMAGMEERARRKADMAEYEKQEAERKAREEAEQNAPRIAVSDLPAETPAAPAETGRGQFPEYYEWLDKTGKKDSDKNWRKFVAENDMDPALAGKRPEPPAEKPAVKPDGKGKMVPVEPKVPVEEAKKPEVAAEPPQEPAETRPVAETGKVTPEPAKPVETPSRASDAKPVPAGKGKMVKPKAEKPTPSATAETPTSGPEAPKVVTKDGEVTGVKPPADVDAEYRAMPYEERVKAQGKYMTAEIAKLEEAIKGKFDEAKDYRGKHTGWTPKDDDGDIPPAVSVKVPGDGEFKVVNNPDGIAMLKKVAAKFKAPPKKGKAETPKAAIKPPSVTVAKKPKAESAEKEMADFVSTDKTRINLTKPFAEGGMVYASDGGIMVRRPLRKGEKVAANGPKGAARILEGAPFDNPDKLDVAATYPKIVQALSTTAKATMGDKGDLPSVEVYRGTDGTIHFRSRDLYGNAYATDNWSKGSRPINIFNGEKLKSILELAAKGGAKEIEIAIGEGNTPTRFRAGDYEGVLMPLKGVDFAGLDKREASNALSRQLSVAGDKWRASLSKKNRETYDALWDAAHKSSYANPADKDAAVKALDDFVKKHGKEQFVADWVKAAETGVPPPTSAASKKSTKPSDRLESRAPEGDLSDLSAEPPKTPEAEINERLDLKRLDPKRRSDPKVLAWAKKNGRNVTNGMATPDAVRAYDEAMTEATAKKARRWFPDMKIVAHKFGEIIKRGMHVIEQRIDDPATIAELEKDTVSRLRSMQLRDGKLYPPMAGKVKSGETGKAEWQEPSEPGIWYRADEHPELLDKNGKFTLVKGNGEQIKAAYNPYWHMSKTALNDQFSSAYKRPELVTVEVSAPRSEAEAKRGEGYWATGAKDPVGETKWPKGPVSGQLAKAGAPERKVTLTRHNKIVRVLPTEEVADRIKAEIDACPRKDVQVEVPFNCVTPQLRDALVERGVKIGKPARLSGPALKEATAAYENWKVEADAINNLEKNWSKSRTASSAEEAASIVKSAGIVNKPLSNKALGIKDAIVTGNNLSEMKNEKAVKKSLSPRLHAIAVANVDKLFETAFTKLTHPDTHGRKEVTQTHRLGSLMKDPATGNYEPVMITVLEYEKYGHRIYTVEAVDVLKYKTPAGQLVDSALPAITPRLQEFVKSLANKAAKVNGGAEKNYLRDTSGGVLGWFDPKSKEVHLLPGADPKTVAHEIMWHGTRQYMTDLAAKGDARAQKFLDMMHDMEQNAPQAIKDLVNRIYARGGKAISRDTLLNEYGAWFTMGKGGEALEKALQKAENRNWFARGLHTVKEMVKDFLTAHGRNRVDLSAIDGMTRDEFVDFLAKEFSSGKTLGNIKGKQPPTLSTKETELQRYKRRFYDQDAAVRDLERDIEKKTGKKISVDDSVEAANALKYGLKEAANIETQGEMREFRKVLAETGIHYEDFEYYAALKAAAGRDAKIDARNIAKLTADLRSQGASAQDIADAVANYKSSNGSHIDPREARMMLNEIENGPDAAKFKKAYDAIRPIIDATLDTQVKAGLVGATEAAQWRTEEPYYIPFKNEYDAETGEWAGRGMSRNYAKPEHYTAKGRQSAAGDILAHIFMDHQAAKLRAIENGVRQKLANLVRANPELGKVEVLGDNEAGIEANNPNVVVFKQGGRAYKITLEGTRGEAIANAFTQRNQLKMGWADRKFMGISMRGFARGTAGLATRYSPTFAVRNTTKDNIELANIVYSELGPIEGTKWMLQYAKVRAATLKNVANVLTGHRLGIDGDTVGAALGKYITTGKIDTSSKGGKILDRYIKAGGLIAGGTRAEAFDSIKKSFTPEAIAKEMRRGNSKKRAFAKHVLNSIGYLNEYAEMATRVGIFATEVRSGKSDAEAALFARRATVDFNRHGDWTPAFNMFRLFSNSTLGATARAAAALTKSKYGAAAMGALFVNGLARAFIDHFANAEEDERRRKTGEATGKDISEYERRTSLFYFRNGDKLYKVAEHESPFSLVSYAGDCVGRWICGDLDGKQVAKNLGVTTAEVAYNFLPMGSINLTAQNGGFAEDAKAALISGVVPTAAQPIAELWANIDYAGRTIYNDPGHDNKTPRAEQGRDSTPDWAKEAAVKLNESTRSEGSRKGYVDIPPEAIQKLVEGYGKNALRDVSMAVSIGEAIIKGDFSKLDPRNEPVKRDFVRPLDGNDKRFGAARKEFEDNMDYFKKTEMTEDERVDYLAKFPHIRGKRGSDLLAAIKKFRKMERGFAYKNGKAIPHEWPQEKLDEFKEKRRALQAQFLELMGE